MIVEFSAERSLLILVDLQEKFRPAVHEMDRVIDKSCRLLQATKILGIPHIVLEQNPKGLGTTVPEIAAFVEPGRTFPKQSFSLLGDDKIAAEIKASGRDQFVIAGIETHVCIAQSASALRQAGNDVGLIEDACSSRYPFDHVTAVDRLRMNGTVITSLEMILFEWMKTADQPVFKAVAGLVK